MLVASIITGQERTKHTLRRQLLGDADARLGEIRDPRETGRVIGKCGHLEYR